ncbi:PRSS1_2_3 [Lepeophtheirus salmonis]|uniref:PRSS1_2_3 n=1 Tax=Lepeophtheirus salmonis TaxID=72036 RepID=A0A7R8CY34_LEPSM|nr:PRSS1_2_3 [Lepeophtheirus salmonis]CAF2967011.1 PRSS1_2_3 [Lepeophtheirus salmonis]
MQNDEILGPPWTSTRKSSQLLSQKKDQEFTVLRSVTVHVVSDEDCSDAYFGSTDETMICAAAPGKDSCQGDSGGPLAQDGTLSSLDLNEKVKPVALPEKDQEFTGDVVVSGWGTISSNGPSCPVLRSVTVHVVSDEDCSDAYFGSTDETMICAAAPGKDSCQGDSGGPLAQDGTLSSLDLNEKVKPVALPEKDQEFTGDVVVSGWGTISSNGPSSPVLRSVTVHVVSDEDCSDAYFGSTDETMICAAAPGKDSCQGDSGGPLAQDGTLVSTARSPSLLTGSLKQNNLLDEIDNRWSKVDSV